MEKHGMTPEEYTQKHPGALVCAPEVQKRFEAESRRVRRRLPPPLEELTVKLRGFPAPVQWDVPAADCLPAPAFYRFPESGALGEDVQEALISLIRKRTLYLWGMPGSGKDAFVHAYSHLTRTPAVLFKVDPGEDIESWFYTRSFNTEGTSWEEGRLLTCLRDGYMTRTGRNIPYLILISDVDRATMTQMESLRMVFDSIQGRVKGPAGLSYPVFPGTQIVMTANTAGSGDSRGRNISAKPIDASILDRFERVFHFHWMDWEDEGIVVQAKFPTLAESYPKLVDEVGLATHQLRAAIHKGDLYAEFSHRTVCAWLGHSVDILHMSPKPPANLLQRASRCWLDKMPDEEARLYASRVLDGVLTGGFLGQSRASTQNQSILQHLGIT